MISFFPCKKSTPLPLPPQSPNGLFFEGGRPKPQGLSPDCFNPEPNEDGSRPLPTKKGYPPSVHSAYISGLCVRRKAYRAAGSRSLPPPVIIKVLIAIAWFLVPLAFLCSCSAHAADPWTKANTVLEATYLVAHLVDYAQTLQISRNPDRYHEINPILGGSHPSRDQVHAYMLGSGLAHVAIAYLLPKPYREIFQSGTLMIKIGIVKHNYDIGLQMRF